jgi:phospholipid-binding lipoprotein MlaA
MLARIFFAAMSLLSLAACATVPDAARDRRDPFQSYNRAMFRANTAIDNGVLLPTTRAYVRVVPAPLRRSVSHFFNNLSYPRTLVNDALQGKLRDAGSDVARLTVNTVLGLGFFDPATRMGLEQHNEDFGQTLGKWGVASGPYLMLPLLGPSTVRDSVGKLPDEWATGRHYIKDTTLKYSLAALDAIDTRVSLLDTNTLLEQSFDRYAFVRNAWLKRREFLVRDGDVPDESLDDSPAPDEPALDEPGPQNPAGN